MFDGTWGDDERISERERLALRYTDAMWHDHRRVDAAFVADLLSELSPDQFLELATVVAQFIGMGQVFAVLGIPNPAHVEP